MRIQIYSDGTAGNTIARDAKTGEILEGVTRIELLWERNRTPKVILHMYGIPITMPVEAARDEGA